MTTEILIYVWVAVMGLALVLEFLTNKLIAVWFTASGLVGLILAIFEIAWYIQLPVAIAVAVPLVGFLRPYIMNKITERQEREAKDPNVGKTFTLLSPIRVGELGTIKINDDVWKVEAMGEAEVLAGTVVKIIQLKDDVYVVEAVKQNG